MPWKKYLYAAHRWVALIAGVQLLLWSLGGLMFSVLHIDNVHGDHERRFVPPPPVRMENVLLSPGEALALAESAGAASGGVSRASLRERRGRTVYEFFDAKGRPLGAVDAATGEVLLRVSEEEAKRAALDDFTEGHTVRSVEFLESEAPLEFRGGAMPVYRVTMEHPKNPRLYVSPVTGDVLARRNAPWRIFDFFWMLHIMDYGGREDFNHPLLTVMSALAVLTAATGLVLWGWRWKRWKGQP
jgi:uncharacterized iron-regulated membrane protein